MCEEDGARMSRYITFEGKRVLLVEDELFLAEKISLQLAALGVKEVLTAANLAEAKQHIHSEQIHLALLDVNLQDGDTTIELGLTLSGDLVPVVYFSGVSTSDMGELSRGFEFLEKPLSVSRLKAAMQRAILRASSLSDSPSGKKMAGREARHSLS